MHDDPVYEEKVTSCCTEALFLGLTGVFASLAAWRVAKAGLDALGWVLLVFALLFLFYSLNYRLLLIRLSPDALLLQFGIFKWAIPLREVVAIGLDDELPPLIKYGGAGIHFMLVRNRYRASFNFLEHHRVVVALGRPGVVRDVSFSTRNPDDLIHHLKAAAAFFRAA